MCYAFFAFLARRFSLRVLPATFFVLLPPLSLFAIGVLHTGDRSGNRDAIVSYPYAPKRKPVRESAAHVSLLCCICGSCSVWELWRVAAEGEQCEGDEGFSTAASDGDACE